MDYFTVEIAGRPIACFRSENAEEADHFFRAEDFREDLTILKSEGNPLWDGAASLSLRKANAEERQEVEHAYEFDDGPDKDIADEFVVFLVPISDPSDDDFDEAD